MPFYAPDAPTINERLPGYPLGTDGEPGGQTLRFPGGEVDFFCENLTGGVDDGISAYNREVRRIGGVQQKGIGTLWHGPNCAEEFQGRFWAMRALDAPEEGRVLNLDAKCALDSIESGRWAGFEGLKWRLGDRFWQRLARLGKYLLLFGYSPTTDGEDAASAVCAISDGQTFKEVDFPYYIRRATASNGSLFVSARDQSEGYGPPRRVIEIQSPETVCSFWNGTAFVLDLDLWSASGYETADLPLYLVWQGQNGRNGGGVWLPAQAAPTEGYYLTRSIVGDEARYTPSEAVGTTSLLVETGAPLLDENGDELQY